MIVINIGKFIFVFERKKEFSVAGKWKENIEQQNKNEKNKINCSCKLCE